MFDYRDVWFICHSPFFSLCERFDAISTKVYEDPQTTEEMVQLVEYLNTVSIAPQDCQLIFLVPSSDRL